MERRDKIEAAANIYISKEFFSYKKERKKMKNKRKRKKYFLLGIRSVFVFRLDDSPQTLFCLKRKAKHFPSLSYT
jgi:hypothetical protein